MQNKYIQSDFAQNTLSTQPIATVQLGEVFTVELKNSFGKCFKTISEFESFMASPAKNENNHPCTGAIHIKGLRKGQSLGVRIRKINIKKVYQCISYSTGIEKEAFNQRHPHIYRPAEDNRIHLKNNLYLKGVPSIGFMATINETPLRGGRCGVCGGNMDIPYLQEGSTIYLPIYHKKALLGVGDAHFLQGMGELSGIALEADAEVELETFACQTVHFPIIEHQGKLVIIGTGSSTQEAIQTTYRHSIRYLRTQKAFKKLSDAQLYELTGGAAHLIAGNLFGKTPTFGLVYHLNDWQDKHGFSLLEPPAPIIRRQKEWDDLLDQSIREYETYPIFHEGDSRQIRLIPHCPNYVISRLNPKIYSFVNKGAVEAAGTEFVRAKLTRHLSAYLAKHHIKTATCAVRDNYVLMTKEDAAKELEIVVKSAFVGSAKHTYKGLMTDFAQHKPYVRFDWRKANPEEDVLLPEGLAARFIHVTQAKQTVLRAYALLKKKFESVDLTMDDACFFLNRQGDTLLSEVSPDQIGTLRYIGSDKRYQAIFADRSKENIINKWQAAAELLGVDK